MRYGTTIAVLAALVLTCTSARAMSRSAEDGLARSVTVSWGGTKFTDCLADLAEQTGVGFVVDPALTADQRTAKVAYTGENVALAIALGRALQDAKLRYTIRNGSIWISTPRRVAERVVYGDAVAVAEAMPMSRSEALDVLAPVDKDIGEYPLSDPRQVRNTPWRRPEDPKLNKATGLVDYPAPPIWIDSPDADNARFKYSRQPSFLKPEHLDKLSDEAKAENEAMGRLARLIRSNPGWDRDRIIVVLEAAAAEE